jgi:hypothetical protein
MLHWHVIVLAQQIPMLQIQTQELSYFLIQNQVVFTIIMAAPYSLEKMAICIFQLAMVVMWAIRSTTRRI